MGFGPETGGAFLGSLNTIRRVISNDCQGKWSMLIDTALPAAGNALWVLLIPSPDEVVEEYLHPRPSRSEHKARGRARARHLRGRTGRSRWWRDLLLPDVGGRRGFPVTDIDEMVARVLPGSRFFRGRRAKGPEQFFWHGIDILDRIAWYWLLLDIGENFVHHWASGIIKSQKCQNDWPFIFDTTFIPDAGSPANELWGPNPPTNFLANQGWQINGEGGVSTVSGSPPVRGTHVVSIDGMTWENFSNETTITLGAYYVDMDGTFHAQPGDAITLPAGTVTAPSVTNFNQTVSMGFTNARECGGYFSSPHGVLNRGEPGNGSLTVYATPDI